MSQQSNNIQAARQDFYDRIGEQNMAPLWEVLSDLVVPEPLKSCAAVHWKYDAVRPFIAEGGELISTKEAERRVLILENPAFRGESRITQTLYAGLQLILPGEIAPSHRHSQSALRFVIEGEGAYTAVDGEKTIMKPGDFVITPAWTWHDHGNESNKPMVWLDGLDVPIVQFLDTSFMEHLGEDTQPLTRPVGDSLARYGSNLLPVDHEYGSLVSPVFNYPYERTREALETLRKSGDFDPWHGIKLKYVHPATGDYAMPTIAVFMQLLPKAFATAPYRSTDSMVYVGVEGHGRTKIGDQVFEWGPRDVFVVPNWTWHSHEVDEDCVLFSYSDRVIQQKLALWREEKGQDGESIGGF